MNATRREFFRGAGLAATGLAAGCCTAGMSGGTTGQKLPRTFSLNAGGQLLLPWEGLAEPVRFVLIGDTHFGFRDSRDDRYADNYRRMGGCQPELEVLERALKRAKKGKADLVVCVGDNISFPTLANVEKLHGALEGCGVPWIYVAGNHDWHFEGDEGSDLEQRARWIEKRLKPLYQGANPLCYSKVVKGVRFVMIDNSLYHVLPEQLAFWKAEAAKGDPVALCMHIPLWTKGYSITTCGHPDWGAATDPYWKIERRQRWAERLMPSTYEFREAVLSTPNLVGVFTGHEHRVQVSQLENGALMFTTAANSLGNSLEVVVG